MIKGIWNGISNAASWLWSKVSGFCDDLVNRIKRKLGIHSPSTVFAELGDYMAQGLGIGFTSQMTNVSRQMQKAIPTSFDFDISSNINRQFSGLKSNLQMQSSSGYAVASSPINLNVEMGDITVQGNADEKVLAKIQQAQKNATDEAVKQFKQTFTGMDLAGLQRSYV